jgi:2-oxo-4-hydroxy-4-carboxy--5-ureidoimidazoline (OHCU) decarboxylase
VPSTGAPPIAEIDGSTAEACAVALAPLFEGAPRFLARLCAARPFGDADGLFGTAREVARSMPEAGQVELIDAHPRLGAPPASVSALSFVEQGYEREAAEAAAGAAKAERRRVTEELDRLNAAYEAQFGFRYCVFVAGRSRAALLSGFEAALSADRDAELARALDAVVDIAADRLNRLKRTSDGPVR